MGKHGISVPGRNLRYQIDTCVEKAKLVYAVKEVVSVIYCTESDETELSQSYECVIEAGTFDGFLPHNHLGAFLAPWTPSLTLVQRPLTLRFCPVPLAMI